MNTNLLLGQEESLSRRKGKPEQGADHFSEEHVGSEVKRLAWPAQPVSGGAGI